MGKRKRSETVQRDGIQHQESIKDQPALFSGDPESRENVQSAQRSEPPPELTKRQRRRWRRKQAKKAKASNETLENAPKHAMKSTANTTVLPSPKRPADVEQTSTLIDRPMLARYSTTQLVPRPQKRWNDYRTSRRSAQSEVLPARSTMKPEVPVFGITGAVRRSVPREIRRRSRSVESESEAGISGLEPKEGDIVAKIQMDGGISLRRTGNSPPFSATTRQPPSHHIIPVPNLSNPVTATNLDSALLGSWPTGVGHRRSSFNQKPNSVPSYSENADAAASFKRFTAFLRSKNIENSDDENSETEGDSESAGSDSNKPLTPLLAVKAFSETSSLPKGERAAAGPFTRHTQHPSRPEAGLKALNAYLQEKQGKKLPRTSLLSQSGLSPGGSFWAADAELKSEALSSREDSLLEPIDPTQDSRTVGIEAHTSVLKPDVPSSPLRSEDETSEDLFKTIDEITHDVFTATRPLPSSKPLVSSESKHGQDRKDGLTTPASSDYRVARSKTTPKSISRWHDADEIPARPNTAIVINAARVPEIHHSPTLPEKLRDARAGGKAFSDSTEQTTRLYAPEEDNLGSLSELSLTPDLHEDDSSSLSELSRTPTPPAFFRATTTIESDEDNEEALHALKDHGNIESKVIAVKKKRRMTGMTSKHFTPEKRLRIRQSAPDRRNNQNDVNVETHVREIVGSPTGQETTTGPEQQPASHSLRSSTRKQRKGTGRKSSYFTPTKPPLDPNVIDRVDFYNTTAGVRNKAVRKVPAGTSTAPVPSITCNYFGIIQEKLWQEPFWLLIAVTFLNKTTGRAAAPVFWALKKRYETPEALAAAPQEDLEALVWHLGLQRQRSKRLIKIAEAWVECPPKQGVRFRTLHYPSPGDGKPYRPTEVVEDDVEDCAGALEIGHIPGCGPYAWDSWRIFCRDVLRGVAHDYNGSEAESEGFRPEWQKVLPLDKELRACLRWMWLREGWIWNCESGARRQATDEEIEMAISGEMEFEDEKEKKFAAQAAGDEIQTPTNGSDEEEPKIEIASAEMTEKIATPETEESMSDNIVLSPMVNKKPVRRSARLTA